ncbi:MAG: Uma2 family endonuclease [Isosphaeraceae bacterium]
MSPKTLPPPAARRATLEDLLKTEGKAELIGGRIVEQMATGHLPNRIAGRIFISLQNHSDASGAGLAYTDSMGFAVNELPSGRESFSPDASFYMGPLPSNPMRFVEGPPTFAAEVRSECDYRDAAERDMAAKREDYFQAGTLVVWDVDSVAGCIWKYSLSSPDRPERFARGDQADAEPAVPGWRVAVDWIFA